MTKPSADLGPAVELAGNPPRAALLFDHACKLQIRTPEALALFFEKRIPSETHQYRHDDTPSCAHSKLWLESGRPGGCAALSPEGGPVLSTIGGRSHVDGPSFFLKPDAHSIRFAVDWRRCKT